MSSESPPAACCLPPAATAHTHTADARPPSGDPQRSLLVHSRPPCAPCRLEAVGEPAAPRRSSAAAAALLTAFAQCLRLRCHRANRCPRFRHRCQARVPTPIGCALARARPFPAGGGCAAPASPLLPLLTRNTPHHEAHVLRCPRACLHGALARDWSPRRWGHVRGRAAAPPRRSCRGPPCARRVAQSLAQRAFARAPHVRLRRGLGLAGASGGFGLGTLPPVGAARGARAHSRACARRAPRPATFPGPRPPRRVR